VSLPGNARVRLGPQVVHGSRDRARVALTFHGQGPVSMAGGLLAEAERAGARVTVLAVGTWLEQYPQMARRILGGGHELGNHTLHHLDIAAMDGSGAYAEIAGCAPAGVCACIGPGMINRGGAMTRSGLHTGHPGQCTGPRYRR
jgi:peptidoglycan/xylan/chitin deacetylase (PgdA/CDA1 family)